MGRYIIFSVYVPKCYRPIKVLYHTTHIYLETSLFAVQLYMHWLAWVILVLMEVLYLFMSGKEIHTTTVHTFITTKQAEIF